MKRLIIDIDDTLSRTENGAYSVAKVIVPVREKLLLFQQSGFTIVLHTSRNMRTYEANIGLINANTIPTLVKWLDLHNIPYDELVVGKPWCGYEGFYVDDKAIRPDEFASLSEIEIRELLNQAKQRLIDLDESRSGKK